jgi:hypothetical protein
MASTPHDGAHTDNIHQNERGEMLKEQRCNTNKMISRADNLRIHSKNPIDQSESEVMDSLSDAS